MKALAWLLLALGFFYAVYTGFMSVWSYMEVSNAVERAADATSRLNEDRAAPAKKMILQSARAAEIAVDERHVKVIDRERTITVQVEWRHPVIIWRGDTILAIPLSLERTYGPAIIR